MPSIAIFHAALTREKEICEAIANATGFAVVDTNQIIEEAGRHFSIPQEKIEKALYQKTSVFNQFTFEKERSVSAMKSIMAETLTQPQKIYFGYIASLISAKISHVLKILLVDSREARTQRGIKQGMNLKDAQKHIRDSDSSALLWTDFLYNLEPFDASLYDIVIPVSEKTDDEIARLVSEQCAQGTVLERKRSMQAIADMAMSAKIEMALLQKGHKVNINIAEGTVYLSINKSVINFTGLSSKLQDIAAPIAQPYEVKVEMGKDYTTSVYRDQEFRLPPKVLLVDDEKDFALTLSERLISRNVGSYAVFDGQEALDFLTDDKPDVIVLDLKMPGVDGLEVLKQTKKNNPDIEIIILTGHGTEEDRKNCLDLGAFAYLQKPTDIKTLSATIHEAHQKYKEMRSRSAA